MWTHQLSRRALVLFLLLPAINQRVGGTPAAAPRLTRPFVEFSTYLGEQVTGVARGPSGEAYVIGQARREAFPNAQVIGHPNASCFLAIIPSSGGPPSHVTFFGPAARNRPTSPVPAFVGAFRKSLGSTRSSRDSMLQVSGSSGRR